MNILLLGNNTREEIEKRIQIVASAGNLSRAEGTVSKVLYTHKDYESNLKLARTIVGYGHKSISEHDYIVFALEDVTPIIEQTIISYRLTSFTIKSRRNVDFRNVGFYTPTFKDNEGNILSNNSELQIKYKKYMQSLFNKYGNLVDEGLPVEDCRYILPYSYHSNIIMGCDANELFRMTSDMLYGNISHITEIKELGERFAKIFEEYIPYYTKALYQEENKSYYNDQFAFLDSIVDHEYKLLEEPRLYKYTDNADDIVLANIIMSRYQVTSQEAYNILERLVIEDSNIKEKMMKALIKSKNQRELEQVIYSFETPISLAVLTHLTRHRMHSLLIPNFVPLWNLENYILPASVKKNHEEEYQNIFLNNKYMAEEYKKIGVREEDLVYFYLSGNACNVYTTMNGRTLEWISRMRCCNKAQWEIRNILDKFVSDVRKVSPLIGTCLGPTCVVEGHCPEGKDSCKNRGLVIKK